MGQVSSIAASHSKYLPVFRVMKSWLREGYAFIHASIHLLIHLAYITWSLLHSRNLGVLRSTRVSETHRAALLVLTFQRQNRR